jgi:hypothetical protein
MSWLMATRVFTVWQHSSARRKNDAVQDGLKEVTVLFPGNAIGDEFSRIEKCNDE